MCVGGCTHCSFRDRTHVLVASQECPASCNTPTADTPPHHVNTHRAVFMLYVKSLKHMTNNKSFQLIVYVNIYRHIHYCIWLADEVYEQHTYTPARQLTTVVYVNNLVGVTVGSCNTVQLATIYTRTHASCALHRPVQVLPRHRVVAPRARARAYLDTSWTNQVVWKK